MENSEKNELERMVLAPYIQKSTALKGKYRYVGGNQFRHAMSTLGILIDYHYINPVLLKASIIHDLFEDVRCTEPKDIISLDSDGPEVYKLVMEVTRREDETKDTFLERILMEGSKEAKILKCADRISNLTDLHADIFDKEFIMKIINETRNWVVPMAEEVDDNMLFELKDLIRRRESNLRPHHMHIWPLKRKDND